MIDWNLIRAAVFDLDGTLIDSSQIWKEVDEEFFSRRGMAVPVGYTDEIAHLGFAESAALTVRKYPAARARGRRRRRVARPLPLQVPRRGGGKVLQAGRGAACRRDARRRPAPVRGDGVLARVLFAHPCARAASRACSTTSSPSPMRAKTRASPTSSAAARSA